ncbi:preprotein translocase subunit SecE [Sandaracinus amylolyticus]|uniref:preprotein translocase subunit SecE n=1 Tax=Sandaracinus amylolyticus TaxID=927083 RepID=UPI001EFFA834|nr:preprotein translocase subunit SecE [Sandaracinus amylolyticus]UJR81833.1 Protein translocase subunit SecE [Sandaracinus amylolyticus]
MADEDDKDLERDGDEDTSSEAGEPNEASADDDVARREAAAIEREERELAEAAAENEANPVTSLLGIERWVQFAFIAAAVITFYLSDRLITFVWGFFAEPDPTIVSGAAALVGIVGAFLLYRHPRVNELAHEVVGELSKVTWPTRDETYYSTVVVIVTSIIAAVYTGVFDALWSAFTDLIYNV